ncbi:AsmA family protein [Shewanella sp. YIC-542]|uniref:AsmA family protein n=1 Tax=Shewanella mytili TaxID=3377111 RepID=UPI00398F5AF2
MKALKWIFGVLALVIVAFTLYLTLLFDPNDFKPQIIAAVEKQTGRTLVIDQDLSWTFFPSVGIEVGGISLSNPDGFIEKQLVSVQKIVANVALLPLLSKEIKISQLQLDGLQLNLETTKDGRNSLDGLTGSKQPAKTTEASGTDSHLTLGGLNIGGISVTNAQVRLLDRQQGSENTFTLASLTLGELALGQFAPLEYHFSGEMPQLNVSSKGKGYLKISPDLTQLELKDFAIHKVLMGSAIPHGEMQVDLTTNVMLDTAKQVVTIALPILKIADITGNGNMSLSYGGKVPQIDATLAMGAIDLDKLLPAEDAPAPQTADAGAKASTATEPDLSGMKAVNMTLALTVDSLKTAGLTTENWAMKARLHNGVLELQQMTADLYQGKLSAMAKLDGRNKIASYQFDGALQQINLRPLLSDMAQVDMLAGSAKINVKGAGRSLLPANIKRNLNANGSFDIADGALYGINIPLMIRNAQDKLKGDLSATNNEEQKTDFTSLTGSFSVKDGVAHNPDLQMSSPLIRLSGAGGANLLQETLDYQLKTALVDSLKGQGGKSSDNLAGIEIPLRISGTFGEPKFSLDTEALFKSQLKGEAEKAKEKLTDSLFKKLGVK